MAAQYATQLDEIDEELRGIEDEIGTLLMRQSELLDRKHEIQELAVLDGAAPSSEDLQRAIPPTETLDWTREFPWTEEIHRIMRETCQLPCFRSVQEEVINATLSKKDVFVIMRSGGGKSLCYQLPALFHQNAGFSVVVSPLISLIQDQVMLFNRIAGDGAACALTGDQSRADASAIYKQLLDPQAPLKLLLATPEKISKSKLLMSRLEKAYQSNRLLRFVIDEAHCCSQWGHDFRSDYSKLGILRRQFPSVPILVLTATATPRLVEDVKSILEIPHAVFFRTSFFRQNLRYEIIEKPDKDTIATETLVELVQTFQATDAGIVYCLTRKECEQVTMALRTRGVRAACYHAYMEDKEQTHHAWCHNELQVVVATIAFGLGINKPDVRFVVHFTLSKSMEGYYQESGRAGRDGDPARCILMYRASDVVRVCNIAQGESGGFQNLQLMIEYCENVSRCRHEIMAQYFGEPFNASESCQNSCDNCQRPLSDSVLMDFTEHAKAIGTIIQEAKKTERRLTLKQLVDELKTRKVAQDVGDTLEPSFAKMPRKECDGLIINLILQEILQPEISYTAYSTNCYIIVGGGAAYRRLVRGTLSVKLQRLINTTAVTANPTTTSKKRKAQDVIEIESDD